MSFYQHRHKQEINASMEEVWDFISSPKNLAEITPDSMNFEITSGDLPERMYPGIIITYTVKPLFGIKVPWMTEITQVKHLEYFIDEQRVGPFKLWHHQHFIEPTDKGVLMKDIVTYSPPFGFLGRIANSIIIENKIKEIFEYRNEAINKRFGNL